MSVRDISEIIAEEARVYKVRYFRPPFGPRAGNILGTPGPDRHNLDDVRILALETLLPGQALRAYEGECVVAHYKADPETGEVVEVFRLD